MNPAYVAFEGEQRIAAGAPSGELGRALGQMTTAVNERHMVGDMDALRTRLAHQARERMSGL